MSTIDLYKHKCLGTINCPSSFNLAYENTNKEILIYQLLENIPLEEESFQGKIGDIILGGGSGEVSSLRISIPETIFFFTDEWDKFDRLEDIIKAYWSEEEAYVFCDGYIKLGWSPEYSIKMWIAENILGFIKKYYYENFKDFFGNNTLDYDGSICRLLTEEEKIFLKS